MKEKIVYLKIVFLFCLSQNAFSQDLIHGIIIDSHSLESVAFSTIVLKNKANKGTISDIHGRFEISVIEMPCVLEVRCVGFKDTLVHVASADEELRIHLARKAFDIEEVVVFPKENPAHRIIREAVKNKKINNPENYLQYSCKEYNKTAFDLMPNPNFMAREEYVKTKKIADSTYLLYMESVINRKYKYYKKEYTNIEASKVSGFKEPSFTLIATDMQSLHFYDDNLIIYDKSYLNPISKGSWRKYTFVLRDTLFQDKDTIFEIEYHPRKKSNFDGLKGFLHINTNKYAIQHIKASPANEKALFELNINQEYQLINDSLWFPVELGFVLQYKRYPSKSKRIKITGRSYFSEIKFDNVQIDALQKENELGIQDSAYTRSNAYWQKAREIPLDEKSKNCYQLLDSLGEKANFDHKLYLFEKIFDNKIPYRIFDFTLDKFIAFNDFEKTRLGVEIYTNENLSSYFSAGGYLAYGTKDAALKYGGSIKIFPKKDRIFNIELGYCKDNEEPNLHKTAFDKPKNLYRNRMSYLQNSYKKFYGKLEFKVNYFTIRTEIRNQEVFSRIANDKYGTKYAFTDLALKLKWAYKEKIITAFGQKFSKGTIYPIVYISYTKGFDGYKGSLEYDIINLSIDKTFNIRHLGSLSINSSSGYIWGNLPHEKLFSGNGSYAKGNLYFIQNTFNTMNLYEYVCQRYTYLFITHNFRRLLFKNKFFQPEIIFVHNLGFGTVNQSIKKANAEIKTPEKGYFESGLLINNVIKFNIFNFFYLGFGGGMFLNYGHYASADIKNNLAWKFSTSLSF